MVSKAAYTIAGAVASRWLAQMVLGAKNTGVIGYAANIAAGAGIAFAAGKFLHNPATSQLILLGTFVGLVLRILTDFNTGPVGAFLKANLSGFGDYQATTFFLPLQELQPASGNRSVASAAAGMLPAAAMPVAMAARAGASGMGGRYGAGRYS